MFLIWKHGEEELLSFIEYLNSIHPTIKFTYKYSRKSIEFLDVLVTREGNELFTDLFVKETDTHQFLHFSSCHPFHTKKGIPYSQAVRMRRICSREDLFQNRISDLKDWLYTRGYEKELVDSQVERASLLDRSTILQGNSGDNDLGGRVVFCTTFHPALRKQIYTIFREAQVVLEVDEEHKKLFSSVPLVSFRRAKTLQDMLVRSKLPSNNRVGSCKACNHILCQICDVLVDSDTFENSDRTRTFSIRWGEFNCSSKFVIYRLICSTCNMQYVGSTVAFRKRFNNYKSHFRKFCERQNAGTLNKGKKVPQAHLFAHFTQTGHHRMEDWQFQIIDGANSEKTLRERESFWQYKLDTFSPKGLNERGVSTFNSFPDE